MKNIFLIPVFIFALVNITSAQKTKVLEKSGKKPEWVNSIAKNYIIVVGSGTTSESAQQNALLKVKERIITSIAENIKTSSEFYRGENSVNGISNMVENYEVSTQTKSADITFLKGISLNMVEEFYWEKVDEDGTIKFYYYIKYPFSEDQLQKLIMEFEKADRELTDELNKIIDNIPNISTVEEINESLGALQKLTKSFIDQRKEKVELGIVKLNEMIKSITIYPIQNSLGEIKYYLKLGDKIISTARNPKVTSNCATITETLNNKTEWIIRYDYSGCYEDPANAVVVAYNLGGGPLKKSFNFDISAIKADIYIHDDINITSLTDDGTNILTAKCQITVISKFDSPVVIDKVILNWENCPPVIIENINMEIKGKGNHDLNLQINQPMAKTKYSSLTQKMISGTLQYKSVTGEKFTYRIYDQNVTTNW